MLNFFIINFKLSFLITFVLLMLKNIRVIVDHHNLSFHLTAHLWEII